MDSVIYIKSSFFSADRVFQADDCEVLQSPEGYNGSCSTSLPDTYVIKLSTGEIISGVTHEYY